MAAVYRSPGVLEGSADLCIACARLICLENIGISYCNVLCNLLVVQFDLAVKLELLSVWIFPPFNMSRLLSASNHCCAAVCSKAYYGSLQRNKIKQHISSPLWGESTGDWWNKRNEIAEILYQVTVDGFPSQRASNTESISMPPMHYTEV